MSWPENVEKTNVSAMDENDAQYVSCNDALNKTTQKRIKLNTS